jgi:hypothetical protein
LYTRKHTCARNGKSSPIAVTWKETRQLLRRCPRPMWPIQALLREETSEDVSLSGVASSSSPSRCSLFACPGVCSSCPCSPHGCSVLCSPVYTALAVPMVRAEWPPPGTRAACASLTKFSQCKSQIPASTHMQYLDNTTHRHGLATALEGFHAGMMNEY